MSTRPPNVKASESPDNQKHALYSWNGWDSSPLGRSTSGRLVWAGSVMAEGFPATRGSDPGSACVRLAVVPLDKAGHMAEP